MKNERNGLLILTLIPNLAQQGGEQGATMTRWPRGTGRWSMPGLM